MRGYAIWDLIVWERVVDGLDVFLDHLDLAFDIKNVFISCDSIQHNL